MIVFNDKPGQLCNRIWSYAPFIVEALERGNKILILSFGEYANLFENLGVHKNQILFLNIEHKAGENLLKVIFLVLRKIPKSLLLPFNIYVDRQNWGKENWPDEILFDKKKIVFLSGWNHPQWSQNILSGHHYLREIFKPKNEHLLKVDSIFEEVRKKFDLIVGVHIRRKDFKYFLGGAYYFEDEIYAGYMSQMGNKVRKGIKLGFLLCSDESVSHENFSNFNIFQIPKANSIEDLYALSLCDYIMGPPSTFSMWASFYGRVPLRIFKSENEILTLDKFSPVTALDHFENGAVLEHVSTDFAYMKKN